MFRYASFLIACAASCLTACFDESNVCETSGVSTTTTASGGAGGEGGAGGSGGSACPFESECDPTLQPPFGPNGCKDTDPLTLDRCVDTHGCGGVCDHVPVQCDGCDPIDVQRLACDDANGCTIDRCDPLNFCTHVACPPPPECHTAACFNEICGSIPVEDGTACGVAGTCTGGQCSE